MVGTISRRVLVLKPEKYARSRAVPDLENDRFSVPYVNTTD
jgi:hypothetical protein